MGFGWLQINLEQIEVNIKALEGKLAHEKSKFQDYTTDLKEAQSRYMPSFAITSLACMS